MPWVQASAGRWHLWFNMKRDHNELDALVLAPDLGAFCIEVKNWALRSIVEYDDNTVVTASGRHRNPLVQAQNAMYGLSNHLREQRISERELPYFYVTAALPRISRSEMYEACGGTDFARHFEGMLFAEDLVGQTELIRRLTLIVDAPPLARPIKRYVPRRDQIEAVMRVLDRKAVLRHAPPPPGVIAAFKQVHASATGSAPPEPSSMGDGRRPTADERRRSLQRPGTSLRNGTSRVVFHGKAGTGKTYELLKIALAHALAGQLTLVCCFARCLQLN